MIILRKLVIGIGSIGVIAGVAGLVLGGLAFLEIINLWPFWETASPPEGGMWFLFFGFVKNALAIDRALIYSPKTDANVLDQPLTIVGKATIKSKAICFPY